MVAHKGSCHNCTYDCCCTCEIEGCYICRKIPAENRPAFTYPRRCSAHHVFNKRFVCFNCHTYQKQNTLRYNNALNYAFSHNKSHHEYMVERESGDKKCSLCNKDMTKINYTIRVPKHNNKKSWKKLEKMISSDLHL